MKNFLLLALISLPLCACQTTVEGRTPDVTVSGDGYEVRVDGDNNSDFCPPGQAKKGNC